MKTIIAPTDFSVIAENACLYAAKLAADIKAELVLFHTIELPLTVAEYPVEDEFLDEQAVKKELKLLRDKLLAVSDNRVNIKIKNVIGSADFQIKELSNRTKPFAVVISTHGPDLLTRFFGGSTTLYTTKHLGSPVIVVPQNASYKPIKKIALACDLRHIYEVPAEELETIIKAFHAKFEIFYVGKNENDINENAVTTTLLDSFLGHLFPTSYSVQNDDVWKGIEILAEEHGIDMVIMIHKKHRPFHRSQAKDFVLHMNIPVMAIHQNDKQAKE